MNNLIRIQDEESNFHFSGESVDKLGASEYTLVNIVVDMSGSVSSYKNELTELYLPRSILITSRLRRRNL